MNHVCRERTADAGRPPRRSLIPWVGLLAAVLFSSTVALAQFANRTPPDGTICPLSDDQTQKSIDAFSKIAAVITSENRCTGCHGRVNPYIAGTGEDKENSNAPNSLAKHAGGKQPRTTVFESECQDCHNTMAPRTRAPPEDNESKWMTAPDDLAFVGRDTATICKQIRGNLPTGEDFLGHLTDDNGGNNFAGTAFMGNRGLENVDPEPPSITQTELLDLAKEWIKTTGGEFKGDKSCGCEPIHYAIRVSTVNDINMGFVHRHSVMQPVDVPITFDDEGNFKGDGAANFQATATAAPCSGTASSDLTFHASGQAIETSLEQSMKFQFANTSPTVTDSSITCPYHGVTTTQTTTPGHEVLPFEFKGAVGETFDYHMPVPIAGVDSTMHVEIVKRE